MTRFQPCPRWLSSFRACRNAAERPYLRWQTGAIEMPTSPAAKTGLPRAADRSAPKVYLVGGGIASLAAAAFMIRDGDMFGHNITILEESSRIGGSLDGAGSPQEGYVLRGGRMIESKYLCTFDLFSSIPTLDERETVTQEIMRWNETMRTSSKARLVRKRAPRDRARLWAQRTRHHRDRAARVATRSPARPHHGCRALRGRVFPNGFLVHVVHHFRLPAVAQCRRIQALPRAVRPHGRGVRAPARHHADGLQPI